MDVIPPNTLLNFKQNTLTEVRKLHGLDNSEKIKDMVDALRIWVREQKHFEKKEFPRHLLETTIISSKGSLEKAQKKLNNICKWRKETPQFFGSFNVRTDFKDFDGILSYGILPNCTNGHERIWIVKFGAGKFKSDLILQYARICIMICEYLRIHDYSDGVVIVIDLLETRMLEATKRLNLQDLRQASTILIEGYGVRVKSMHILSSSKVVNILVWLLKQVLNTKLVSRVSVHQNIEAMHSAVSFKNSLPVEYGGNEKSFKSIHENWLQELSSKEFMRHLTVMSAACSEETLRSTAD